MAQTDSSTWYIGSDLKFLVRITGEGFDMDENEWGVTLYIDNKPIKRYANTECVRGDDDWFVCIPKEDITKFGRISLVADAQVPDNDFDAGIRNEVDKVVVGTYSKI